LTLSKGPLPVSGRFLPQALVLPPIIETGSYKNTR